jgi:hypothetical protein
MSKLEDMLLAADATTNVHAYEGALASSGQKTVDDFDRPKTAVTALQDNFRADNVVRGTYEPATIKTNYKNRGIKFFNEEFTNNLLKNDNFLPLDPIAKWFNRYKPLISATVGTDRKVTIIPSEAATYIKVIGDTSPGALDLKTYKEAGYERAYTNNISNTYSGKHTTPLEVSNLLTLYKDNARFGEATVFETTYYCESGKTGADGIIISNKSGFEGSNPTP